MLKRSYSFVFLLLAQTLFAQGLSKNCVNEFLAIPEKIANFEMQSFLKDLATEVVSVKGQLKMPFGKPADSKVTSIGITVGCLKALPENPAQIQAALKDVITEMAKRMANKLETSAVGPQSQSQVTATSPSVLKECDAVFNPEKKFCYDGRVYDKCDGMPYNPTTHICSVDVAYRALCDGKQYNPLFQKCENNAILATCGKVEYNPKTHGCKSNTVFALSVCGGTFYNPETHGCGQNNVLLIKCNALYYNPEKYGCENGVPLPKCGEALYNPETHGCSSNVVLPKCGTTLYDPATHNCSYKCGEVLYNPETHGCSNNVVLTKCGTVLYDPATHNCQKNFTK